ncbi:MAG TPA: hypothetical protein VGE97_10205 [Nitrososphaera sp.]|jgi:hypothetical protein
MKPKKLVYQDYAPLYANGKRDAAKRYVNKAGDIISVRQFQKNAHGEAGTAKQSARTEQVTMKAFFNVVKRLGKGETLGQAAKAEGISPSTIRTLNEQRTPDRMHNGKLIPGASRRVYSPAYKINQKTGKTVRTGFQLNEPDTAPVLIIKTDGSSGLKTIPCDRMNSHILGSYWVRVSQTLDTGNYDLLKPFEGRYVYDLDGKSYPLITDPATLEYAIIGLPDTQYKDLWSRFSSSQRVA